MNTAVKDYHPLWAGTNLNNKYTPYMTGVYPREWQVPISECGDSYMISSPVPRPNFPVKRVIAYEVAPLTVSKSYAYDYPKRNEVIQVTLPESKTRVTESHIDLRNPPKMPVDTTKNPGDGPIIYGTGNSLPADSMFLQKKISPYERIQTLKEKSTDLLHQLGLDTEDGTIVYNTVVKNPKDEKKEESLTEKKKMKKLEKTKLGIRAMNTFKKLN